MTDLESSSKCAVAECENDVAVTVTVTVDGVVVVVVVCYHSRSQIICHNKSSFADKTFTYRKSKKKWESTISSFRTRHTAHGTRHHRSSATPCDVD